MRSTDRILDTERQMLKDLTGIGSGGGNIGSFTETFEAKRTSTAAAFRRSLSPTTKIGATPDASMEVLYSKPTIVMSESFKKIMSPTGFECMINGMESTTEAFKDDVNGAVSVGPATSPIKTVKRIEMDTFKNTLPLVLFTETETVEHL